jgi:CBS domain-containing membrane protein
MVPPVVQRLFDWLRAFWPAPSPASLHERLRSIGGALIGIALTAWLSRLMLPAGLVPWLVAPMGASAVLVFAVPGSPLAQPWSVVGGNTLSALVGVVAAHFIPDTAVAAAVAVSGAIAVMFATRSLHPPGGASALFAVMAAPALAPLGWRFPVTPVLVNAALLTAAGVLYNSATRRSYPHRPAKPLQPEPREAGFTRADLDAVLARHAGLVDVARDELEDLLHEAELQAHRRRLGQQRCGDVARAVPTAEFGTPLHEAWETMRSGGHKALAVVNRFQRVIGIITQADFLKLGGLDRPDGIGHRLRERLRPLGLVHSELPEVVGQVMQPEVLTIATEAHVLDLVPMFARSGHRQVPVIDARGIYRGMLAQSDLIEVLTDAMTDRAWRA